MLRNTHKTMIKNFSTGSVNSAAVQAKEDKEHLNRTIKPTERCGTVDFSKGETSGNKNLCVFGVHKTQQHEN